MPKSNESDSLFCKFWFIKILIRQKNQLFDLSIEFHNVQFLAETKMEDTKPLATEIKTFQYRDETHI